MIAAGIGITLLCLLQISRAPFDKQVRKYFIVFLSFVLSYILMHLTRQMMDGVAGEGVKISLYIVTFIEFTVSCLMSIMLSQMILYIAAPKKGSHNHLYRLLCAPRLARRAPHRVAVYGYVLSL